MPSIVFYMKRPLWTRISLTFAKLSNSSLQCWILFARNKSFWIPSVATTYADGMFQVSDIYVRCKNILPIQKIIISFLHQRKTIKQMNAYTKTESLKSYITQWNDYYLPVCGQVRHWDADAYKPVMYCTVLVRWWPSWLWIIYSLNIHAAKHNSYLQVNRTTKH